MTDTVKETYDRTATGGITQGFCTPCMSQKFEKTVLANLFEVNLPVYRRQLRSAWEGIQETAKSVAAAQEMAKSGSEKT